MQAKPAVPLWFNLGWLLPAILVPLLAAHLRTLWPIDETRYASVAWEMWSSGDFILPTLNGEPYSHKPPLLFWLMHLGWWLFGVNDVWPRLIPGLAGLSCAVLVRVLGRRLWPDHLAGVIAPWLLATGFGWLLYSTALYFDLLMALCVTAALLALREMANRPSAWPWLGLAMGLAVLAKGPVVLAYVLPPTLLAPWWADPALIRRSWYLGGVKAVALATAIGLAWAIPAAIDGGRVYTDQILWGQTAGRMLESFAHRRPFWWYVPALVLMWLPWSLWGNFGASLLTSLKHLQDRGVRFCLAVFVPGLLILSLVSGKQPHYLLPLFPVLALLVAWGMAERQDYSATKTPNSIGVRGFLVIVGAAMMLAPVIMSDESKGNSWVSQVSMAWGIGPLLLALVWSKIPAKGAWQPLALMASTGVFVVISGYLAIARPAGAVYDLTAFSQELAKQQMQDRPMAFVGKYRAQFQFLGRLPRGLERIGGGDQIAKWAAAHPQGIVVDELDDQQQCEAFKASLCVPYRLHYMAMIPAAQISTQRLHVKDKEE